MVADRRTGAIVSCLHLLSHTWTYGGVPIAVGQPELMATFPDRTFLQLLFGFRSLSELEAAFPDCLVRTPEARALLNALFPKRPSDVWPVL